MNTQIITAIIASIPALVTAIVTVILNNRLIAYKIEQLESKVEKHNKVIERTAVLERDVSTAFKRVDELRNDINKINDRMIK